MTAKPFQSRDELIHGVSELLGAWGERTTVHVTRSKAEDPRTIDRKARQLRERAEARLRATRQRIVAAWHEGTAAQRASKNG